MNRYRKYRWCCLSVSSARESRYFCGSSGGGGCSSENFYLIFLMSVASSCTVVVRLSWCRLRLGYGRLLDKLPSKPNRIPRREAGGSVGGWDISNREDNPANLPVPDARGRALGACAFAAPHTVLLLPCLQSRESTVVGTVETTNPGGQKAGGRLCSSVCCSWCVECSLLLRFEEEK